MKIFTAQEAVVSYTKKERLAHFSMIEELAIGGTTRVKDFPRTRLFSTHLSTDNCPLLQKKRKLLVYSRDFLPSLVSLDQGSRLVYGFHRCTRNFRLLM